MALKKKFGKYYYHFDSQFHNETKAKSRADKLRKVGDRARVVKVDWLTWEIWRR